MPNNSVSSWYAETLEVDRNGVRNPGLFTRVAVTTEKCITAKEKSFSFIYQE